MHAPGTPGPWKQIVERETAESGRVIVSRYIVGGKPLAYIARIESESDHSRNALDAPGKNAEGNGGLIATAPDLFRELYDATTLIGQLLFDNVLTDPESRQLHNRMLATLQKAEL